MGHATGGEGHHKHIQTLPSEGTAQVVQGKITLRGFMLVNLCFHRSFFAKKRGSWTNSKK